MQPQMEAVGPQVPHGGRRGNLRLCLRHKARVYPSPPAPGAPKHSPTNSGVPKLFLNSFPASILWAMPKSMSLMRGFGTPLSRSMMFSGWGGKALVRLSDKHPGSPGPPLTAHPVIPAPASRGHCWNSIWDQAVLDLKPGSSAAHSKAGCSKPLSHSVKERPGDRSRNVHSSTLPAGRRPSPGTGP